MRIGHTTVIAIKKREEIDRQIMPINLGQSPHNTAIQRNVMPALRTLRTDKHIARMHVRMKKSVSKHLRKENLNPVARQTF